MSADLMWLRISYPYAPNLLTFHKRYHFPSSLAPSPHPPPPLELPLSPTHCEPGAGWRNVSIRRGTLQGLYHHAPPWPCLHTRTGKGCCCCCCVVGVFRVVSTCFFLLSPLRLDVSQALRWALCLSLWTLFFCFK